jgi:uncharacterized integral membrane protein
MSRKIIVLIILAIIFVILIVQNSKPIEVEIFFWTIYMSQIIIFFIILAIGFIGGYIVAKLEDRKRGSAK